LDVITIHTTVKMHGHLVTRSTRHTVNSSQRRYIRRSTRHTILGDFWVWRVDRVTSWLYPVSVVIRFLITLAVFFLTRPGRFF